MKKQNAFLVMAILVLAIMPLFLVKPATDGSDIFGGADVHAEEQITKISPNYEPWFSPLWEPPSGEIESLLFALQAAIGAGLVFYTVGYFRGKRKGNMNK